METHRADAAVGRELAANWSFHTLVLRAAHNPLLELMAEPIYYVLRTRFAENRASGRFREQVEDHHRAIAAAIFDRDNERASEEMRVHLEYLRPFYLDVDTRLGRK
ncbi:FadR/GntR family transcriptional regulator [Actinomycetota bacterium]